MNLNLPKYKCPSCDLTFFSLKNRETHLRKAHMEPDDSSYRCAKCDMNFVTHKEFNVHKKSVHGKEIKARFQCRIINCKFETNKRDELSKHCKTLHPGQVHICSDCGRNFAGSDKLLQHQASHARSGRGRKCLPALYTCSKCSREFNRKRHMELHMLFKHSTGRFYHKMITVLTLLFQRDHLVVNNVVRSSRQDTVSTST